MLPAGSTDHANPDPPPASPLRRRWIVLGAAALAAIVAVVGIVALVSRPEPATKAASSASPKPTATANLSVAEVYAALAPSVVSVQAVTGDSVSSGTGVIANADGLVLTARHVIKGATSIRLTFADGTRAQAAVVVEDPAIDIAMLAPDALPIVVVPAVIGNSGRLNVGDDVVAIGNPLGLTGSTTAGVVSGLNRSATGKDGLRLRGLIQFDAAVNPGSSGGPLVNTKGETIGIVVALINPSGSDTFIGIGFAVPIGTAVAAGGEPGPQQ